MDPYVPASEYRGAESLAVALMSSLCAMAGLGMAIAGALADGPTWLLAGLTLGVFGPVAIRLLARRTTDEGSRGSSQAGLPYTATTTERSRLFSDHTPIEV